MALRQLASWIQSPTLDYSTLIPFLSLVLLYGRIDFLLLKATDILVLYEYVRPETGASGLPKAVWTALLLFLHTPSYFVPNNVCEPTKASQPLLLSP